MGLPSLFNQIIITTVSEYPTTLFRIPECSWSYRKCESCRCWDPNLGLLQDHSVLLTPEQSTQSLSQSLLYLNRERRAVFKVRQLFVPVFYIIYSTFCASRWPCCPAYSNLFSAYLTPAFKLAKLSCCLFHLPQLQSAISQYSVVLIILRIKP